MDWKTILLQCPYHPKWSTELIQALSKFQGHFLQKETKGRFERRNLGCRVYDDLCGEVAEVCGLQNSAHKHCLILFPRSARQSPAQFPSLAGEYVYKTETKWRNACREHQRGKRWLPDDWSLPGAGSCELRAGKRNLNTCPVASLGAVWRARVLQGLGALQPPNHPVTAETPTPTRPAAPNPETPSIQMGILEGILMAL